MAIRVVVCLIQVLAIASCCYGQFTLAPLPYAYDALEPHIDAKTMTLHHTSHQNGSMARLNAAVAKAGLQGVPLEDLLKRVGKTGEGALPEDAKRVIQTHGASYWNHAFFWQVMAPPSQGYHKRSECPDFIKAAEGRYGSVEKMMEEFKNQATNLFGSGWVWIVVDNKKQLEVISLSNQDNPLFNNGRFPVLGIDVWEHAYYLKHNNGRPKYLEEWFKVINWKQVNDNYKAVANGKVDPKKLTGPL